MEQFIIFLISYWNQNLTSSDFILKGSIVFLVYFSILYVEPRNKVTKFFPVSSLFVSEILLKIVVVIGGGVVIISVIFYFCYIDITNKNYKEILGNVHSISHTQHYLFETKILMNTFFLLTLVFGIAITSAYPFKKSIFTNIFIYMAIFIVFIPFSLLYLDFIFYENYYIQKLIVGLYGWGDYDNKFKMKIYTIFILTSFTLITMAKVLEKKYVILKMEKRRKKIKLKSIKS